MGKFGENSRGGVGKSGVLENKSGNISDTRKDTGKVYYELTNALSNGNHPDPLRPPLPFPKIGGPQPPLKTVIENRGKNCT